MSARNAVSEANVGQIDIRDEAKRLVESLPAHSSWDDLMHEIYVRQAIEGGLADSREGRTVEFAEGRKRFGFS